MRRLIWATLLVASLARADFLGGDPSMRSLPGRDFEEPVWAEDEVALPPYPKEADLIEFYVSPSAINRFFVDGATLGVGKDGVVRYALVVKSPGGATNVTYEGIRCSAGEYRLYATGRADGTWIPARLKAWRPIENKVVNRHHAVLSRELFCPVQSAIGNADEGRDALRRGRHPAAP